MIYGQRNGGNGRYGRGVGHRNRNRVISETTASIAGMRVAIVRKPIKNMYLRIKPPNADIVISAPQRMSQSAIERFVTERKPWIERAQRSMRQARDAQLNAQRAQNGNIGDTGASANPPAFVWTDEAKARAQRNIESQLIGLAALCGTAHHSTVTLARTPFYLSHSADVSHTVSHVVPCREKRHFTARAAAYAATRAASVTSRTITQTQASAASAALAPISTTPSNQL